MPTTRSVGQPPSARRSSAPQLFVGLGVPAADADRVAATLVESDLKGVHSHGANLMSLYVTRIRSGHIKPVTEVTVVGDHGSSVMLDGGLGLGQISGIRPPTCRSTRPRSSGWPPSRCASSPTSGRSGYYTNRAAEQGLHQLGGPERPGLRAALRRGHRPVLHQPLLLRLPGRRGGPGGLRHRHHRGGRQQDPPGQEAGRQGDPGRLGERRPRAARRPTPRPPPSTTSSGSAGTRATASPSSSRSWPACWPTAASGGPSTPTSPVHGKDRVAKGALFLAIDPASFPGGRSSASAWTS